MIQTKCEFTFKGEKGIVSFPTVGQMLDMESLKLAITSNRYAAMSASGIKSMFFALDLVDAIVFFQVLYPKLKRKFDVREFSDLEPEAGKELVELYKEQILPWYSEVLEELYSANDAKTKDPDTKD